MEGDDEDDYGMEDGGEYGVEEDDDNEFLGDVKSSNKKTESKKSAFADYDEF